MTSHVFVLGEDNLDMNGVAFGPHSTAVAIGPEAVLACAHSLSYRLDESKFVPKRKSKKQDNNNDNNKQYYRYNEIYWIQRSVTKDKSGNYTDTDRIPVVLYKFHLQNDWALFRRIDGGIFEHYPQVDDSLLFGIKPDTYEFADAIVLHCPVSLLFDIRRPFETIAKCNKTKTTIQHLTTHHLRYDNIGLCRGSSGGAVQLAGSSKILGLHHEAHFEVTYDADTEDIDKVISPCPMRVDSEDSAYAKFDGPDGANPGAANTSRGTVPPGKESTEKSVTESVASLCGGNSGMGSALIICNFPKLMYYIDELNKTEVL